MSPRTGNVLLASTSRAARVRIGVLAAVLPMAPCFLLSCNRGELSGDVSLASGRTSDDGDDADDGLPSDVLVAINEVMLENTSTLEDDDGKFPPWIEIYNPSEEETLDLRGILLSDELTDLEKWFLPDVSEAVMPPLGFLVIFADGRADELGGLHTSFRLRQDTPQIQLIINSGSDIVFVNPADLEADRSAGRFPDGDLEEFSPLTEPTPGAPNSEPSVGVPAEGEFVRGDVNSDGVTDVSDMSRILRIIFRGEPRPPCEDRLDANDDGEVNLTDATFIGDAFFRDGPGIPPPFPEEGVDPTPDSLPCPLP